MLSFRFHSEKVCFHPKNVTFRYDIAFDFPAIATLDNQTSPGFETTILLNRPAGSVVSVQHQALQQ